MLACGGFANRSSAGTCARNSTLSSIDRAATPGAGTRASGNIDGLLATWCFAAACAVALAGAFVGLDTFGFWLDELFTLRVLQPYDGSGGLFARIATDVHPPLYPVLLFLYSKVAGDSDAALRSFSAFSACAAVLTFVAATKSAFSLPGRLFGAALATGSLFWFFQSQ